MNLEFWRKQKGLSQAQLAELMNAIWAKTHPENRKHYSSDMISRMERNTDSINLADVLVIQEALGVNPDQLISPKYLPPKIPQVKNNWDRVERLRKRGLALAKECSDPNLAEELNHLVRNATRKPKIAFMGRPDAGKSTLQNLLLEQKENWLPTGWSPETSAICYLKHINDRPTWVGNDRVLIFRDPPGESFNSNRMEGDKECENYCKLNCIAAGGYDLLPDYASHSGMANAKEIGAIVIYVDAPILANCDFIDLPGFNPEGVTQKGEEANSKDLYDSHDSMLSIKTCQQADAIIYMSIANSFFYGDDAEMAKNIITSIPIVENKIEKENKIAPLGNIFILASQAMAVNGGAKEELQKVLDGASKRLWSRVQEHPAIERRGEITGYTYNYDTLRARFFTSESTSGELTEKFFSDLIPFVELLPIIQANRVRNEVCRFCDDKKNFFTSKLDEYIAMRDERDVEQSRLEEDEKKDSTYCDEVEKNAAKVLQRIDILAKESDEAVEVLYHKVINASHIKEIIEEKGYKKNKRDMAELSNDLNAELNNKLSQMLMDKSQVFSGEIDQFIENLNSTFSGPELEHLSFKFDVGRAFIGGMAGIASFGALAAWAATCGNLGGYIVVAKVVSVLASMGIHVGGTAAAMSAVAAIGGPITLGIGVAVIAALGMIALLGGTWKKTIGNKIVKQYEKAEALIVLKRGVADYWKNTRDAFQKCCDNILKEWKNSLKERRAIMEEGQGNNLNSKIKETQSIINFLKNVIEKFKVAENDD